MKARWHEFLFWIGHPQGMRDHCDFCQLRARRIRYLSTQLKRAEAQRDALAALIVEMERRRTTGGLPKPFTHTWERGTLPPPPSASDPDAPPLGAQVTTTSGKLRVTPKLSGEHL